MGGIPNVFAICDLALPRQFTICATRGRNPGILILGLRATAESPPDARSTRESARTSTNSVGTFALPIDHMFQKVPDPRPLRVRCYV